MGASGLLPVLLGLAQSSGLEQGSAGGGGGGGGGGDPGSPPPPPRFSVRTFYLLILAVVAAANAAFYVLHRAERAAAAAWGGDCSRLEPPLPRGKAKGGGGGGGATLGKQRGHGDLGQSFVRRVGRAGSAAEFGSYNSDGSSSSSSSSLRDSDSSLHGGGGYGGGDDSVAAALAAGGGEGGGKGESMAAPAFLRLAYGIKGIEHGAGGIEGSGAGAGAGAGGGRQDSSHEEGAAAADATAAAAHAAAAAPDGSAAGAPPAAGKLDRLRRGWQPLAGQLLVSGLNYAVFPGMLPFLVADDGGGLLLLTSSYFVANLLGRWMPAVHKFHGLGVLNGLQLLLYAGCCWAAARAGGAQAGEGAMAAAIALFSFNNGYCATMVYENIRVHAGHRGLGALDLEFLLQAGGICGQIGSAVGTLLTTALVSQGVFKSTSG